MTQLAENTTHAQIGVYLASASLAGDLKISEVVDVPHVLVSMHIPKGIFH